MIQKMVLRSTFWIFLGALLLAGIAHGYNMLNYPYYENDEGTYFSQAYSLFFEGRLSPYTYWYDHAPFGWVVAGLWLVITGGPFTFGYSLHSARILMLIVHLFESALMFVVVKKMSKKNWIAFLSVVFFSVTPLGIYFQRRLLLDNLMTFWLFVTLWLLLFSRERLWWVLVGGIAFSFAVLTKETALLFLPIFALIAYFVLQKEQRIMGLTVFITPVGLGIFYFILFAALKGELFPGTGHVSLVETWIYQLTRGNNVPFWYPESDFMVNFWDWWNRDPVFFMASLFSVFWVIVTPQKSRSIRFLGLGSLVLFLFFMRGGLVINFYIIPFIALSSITLAFTISNLIAYKFWGNLFVGFILPLWILTMPYKQWFVDEASVQKQSINWIKKNLEPSAVLAIDNSHFLDLQKSRFPADPEFPNAHWFWKMSKDPQIRDGSLAGDWQNIDYIILSHEFLKQIKVDNVDFIKPTVNHSKELSSWGPVSAETYLDLPQYISTNGDWIKVLKLLDRHEIVLLDSWQSYKHEFITQEGQVIDPQTDLTTSEGQSYALLRSVVEDDLEAFAAVWNWTQSHFQYRNEDNLFSWKWGKTKTGEEKVLDPAAATDADIDIATALILASRTWDVPMYEIEALTIIDDIWRQEVVQLSDGRYYLIAGTWAGYGDAITINPSYISPAAFELFAEVDTAHPWLRLKRDSYTLLNRLVGPSGGELPPDWIAVSKETQEFVTPEPGLSPNYGYDAMRVFFRVAQDYWWFDSRNAYLFLKNNDFLVDYFAENGEIPAGFRRTGMPRVEYEDNAFYGSYLPYFKVVDESAYQKLSQKLSNDYENGRWKLSDNYYTQNWVWLGIALAEGKYTYEK